LGNVYYFHSERTNLGPVRNDVNAIYDLASHDISIFNFLMDATPKVLATTAKSYLRPEIEDVAFISLEYPGGVLAHIHVSWLDPRKVREITAVGNEKMATWNDLSLSGPIRIYSKHLERNYYYKDYGEFQLLAKDGEVVIPNVQNAEPLKGQAEHFIQCILSRRKPIASGEDAIRVMQVLAQTT